MAHLFGKGRFQVPGGYFFVSSGPAHRGERIKVRGRTVRALPASSAPKGRGGFSRGTQVPGRMVYKRCKPRRGDGDAPLACSCFCRPFGAYPFLEPVFRGLAPPGYIPQPPLGAESTHNVNASVGTTSIRKRALRARCTAGQASRGTPFKNRNVCIRTLFGKGRFPVSGVCVLSPLPPLTGGRGLR